MPHQSTSVRVLVMTGSEYTVEHGKKLEWYLTNSVQDLKTKFSGFQNCGIPIRHF